MYCCQWFEERDGVLFGVVYAAYSLENRMTPESFSSLLEKAGLPCTPYDSRSHEGVMSLPMVPRDIDEKIARNYPLTSADYPLFFGCSHRQALDQGMIEMHLQHYPEFPSMMLMIINGWNVQQTEYARIQFQFQLKSGLQETDVPAEPFGLYLKETQLTDLPFFAPYLK